MRGRHVGQPRIAATPVVAAVLSFMPTLAWAWFGVMALTLTALVEGLLFKPPGKATSVETRRAGGS